mmetsp:Transcript_19408/g.42035  ORF Transcript_19408/g.42035 Transcript_19408/m.42035 type:complete len:312 (+) Transcript_19408:69-1004(+)
MGPAPGAVTPACPWPPCARFRCPCTALPEEAAELLGVAPAAAAVAAVVAAAAAVAAAVTAAVAAARLRPADTAMASRAAAARAAAASAASQHSRHTSSSPTCALSMVVISSSPSLSTAWIMDMRLALSRLAGPAQCWGCRPALRRRRHTSLRPCLAAASSARPSPASTCARCLPASAPSSSRHTSRCPSAAAIASALLLQASALAPRRSSRRHTATCPPWAAADSARLPSASGLAGCRLTSGSMSRSHLSRSPHCAAFVRANVVGRAPWLSSSRSICTEATETISPPCSEATLAACGPACSRSSSISATWI